MDNIKIGYLGFSSPSQNTYLGGIMVCDDKGFPLEFRYSEPIQPSNVQKVLYGKVLEKYIKVDVISESLLKSVQANMTALIVEDEYILEQSFSANFPILRMASTKSPPLSDLGDNVKIKDNEYLLQACSNSNPLRILFSPVNKVDESKIKTCLQALAQAGNKMDLNEPLSRVERALELICQQTQAQQKDSKS